MKVFLVLLSATFCYGLHILPCEPGDPGPLGCDAYRRNGGRLDVGGAGRGSMNSIGFEQNANVGFGNELNSFVEPRLEFGFDGGVVNDLNSGFNTDVGLVDTGLDNGFQNDLSGVAFATRGLSLDSNIGVGGGPDASLGAGIGGGFDAGFDVNSGIDGSFIGGDVGLDGKGGIIGRPSFGGNDGIIGGFDGGRGSDIGGIDGGIGLGGGIAGVPFGGGAGFGQDNGFGAGIGGGNIGGSLGPAVGKDREFGLGRGGFGKGIGGGKRWGSGGRGIGFGKGSFGIGDRKGISSGLGIGGGKGIGGGLRFGSGGKHIRGGLGFGGMERKRFGKRRPLGPRPKFGQSYPSRYRKGGSVFKNRRPSILPIKRPHLSYGLRSPVSYLQRPYRRISNYPKNMPMRPIRRIGSGY
ncbi:uncharacterized protein LOC133201295 [Saccostrea echinata]|uniref:uncharacterized protein LOC133201295 n=1 Tax=Saccostrea echinata TaxID=191078 RepID=UPI002A81AAD9|nr:uncharacterized protein LOC133201295 [Saccostrea echinata]